MPRSIPLKHYFLKDINSVVKYLIVSDTVIVGAAGLLGPIFALFIEGFIDGGNAAVAGIAAAIYLLARSIIQIPVASVLDRIRGERDDFKVVVVFSIIMGLIPLSYLFIDQAWQLYLTQLALGIATAFTFPSYMAIFTRHIDKTHEGLEWGVYFTMTDLSAAALAAIGGYVATTIGFHALIITVVVLSVFGSLLLIPIKPYLKLR
ncbi:MAG: MFS transporter [Candidatus Uhrbacteria bacterium]